MLSPFLKVKSLHASDPLISLSGVGVGTNGHAIHFLPLVNGGSDPAVEKGIVQLKHLQCFTFGAAGRLIISFAILSLSPETTKLAVKQK